MLLLGHSTRPQADREWTDTVVGPEKVLDPISRIRVAGQFRPAMIPPSTLRMAPVIQSDRGESRNVIALATSVAVPTRPDGRSGANVASVASMSSGATRGRRAPW